MDNKEKDIVLSNNPVLTKDQHTIPECYLKNFIDDDSLLYQRDKTLDDSKNSRVVSIEKATVKRKFYTLNGSYPMLMETDIYGNVLEKDYPKMYVYLISKNPEDLDLSTKESILIFFFSLYCRTPKHFDIFLKSVPNEYLFELDKIKEDYKIAHFKDVVMGMVDAHISKKFTIITSVDSSEFISCDNPVIIQNKLGQLETYTFGSQRIVNHNIAIPLNRKKCLLLTNFIDQNDQIIYNHSDNFKIYQGNATKEYVNNINLLLRGTSERYIYGSKKGLNIIS
ncbi:MAG: DUF4238 domain-containing protein [Bacteroidetes bacterium]|nr:DUF4238 domain-containing protein [Bacteroidota bacterium]